MTPRADVEAERAVIGSMLLDTKAALVALELGLMPEHFADRRCRLAFCAAIDLAKAGRPIDVVELRALLSDRQELGAVGGLPGLVALGETVATAANARHYCARVKSKAKIRALADAAKTLIGEAEDASDGDAFVGEQLAALVAAVGPPGAANKITRSSEWAAAALARLQRDHEAEPSGVLVGFGVFDRAGGLQPGHVQVIAGRPSMGKTVFAQCLALGAAERGHPTMMVSLEMTQEELTKRMFAMRTDLSLGQINQPKRIREPSAWEEVYRCARSFAEIPLTLWDPHSLDFDELRAAVLQFHATNPVGLLIVDYLQLIRVPNRYREQEIAEVSRRFKALAKEIHAPVVLLAQLNREVEKRVSKLPLLSDLRESGAIEQDADFVGMPNRPIVYDDDAPAELACLHVVKNRHGQAGRCALRFSGPHQRFEDATFADFPPYEAYS